MSHATSRFEAVSRRAFIRGSLAAGALAAIPGMGCGHNDAEILGSAGSASSTGATSNAAVVSTADTASAGTGASSSTTTGVVASTASSTPQRTAAPSTTPPPAITTPTTPAPLVSPLLPAGAELVVDFTFAPSSGGRIQNPYVAVWIEDVNEVLVQTMAIWVQSGKGSRWVPDLRRWYQRAGADAADAIAALSAATRAPGAYSVVWNGTDAAGRPVASGTYFVCIEAAREQGPYELIREPFSTTGTSTVALPDSGELTSASVSLRV